MWRYKYSGTYCHQSSKLASPFDTRPNTDATRLRTLSVGGGGRQVKAPTGSKPNQPPLLCGGDMMEVG